MTRTGGFPSFQLGVAKKSVSWSRKVCGCRVSRTRRARPFGDDLLEDFSDCHGFTTRTPESLESFSASRVTLNSSATPSPSKSAAKQLAAKKNTIAKTLLLDMLEV